MNDHALADHAAPAPTAAESFLQRARRRALTIPTFVLGFLLTTALFPLLAVVAFAVDLVRPTGRRTFSTVRVGCFVWAFFAAQMAGLSALLLTWLVTPGAPARRAALTWRVQRWYTAMLMGAVSALFSLRFTVEGQELAATGPLLVLARHASIVDTLVPGAFIANRFALRLRYVLKRELLSDPCLDVAGHWIPNHFIARDGADTDRELAALRALKAGLTGDEGVLIYPEGTRFSAAKRQRLLDRLADDPRALARTQALRHLLPPRPGGTLALLDAAPACDVLLVGHHGLEGFTRVADIWAGALVGRHIRVRFWREPAASVPKDQAERLAWLDAQWRRIDDWLEATQQEAPRA